MFWLWVKRLGYLRVLIGGFIVVWLKCCFWINWWMWLLLMRFKWLLVRIVDGFGYRLFWVCKLKSFIFVERIELLSWFRIFVLGLVIGVLFIGISVWICLRLCLSFFVEILGIWKKVMWLLFLVVLYCISLRLVLSR